MAKLDWNKIARVNFDERRRAAHGQKTGRQLFQNAYANLEKSKEMAKKREQIEPLLKKALLDHMVNRKPIIVLAAFQTSMEVLQKSDWGAQYVETMHTIPAGSQLLFKGREGGLGQWIFETQDGSEITIYEKPMIMFGKSVIQNPGFYGLLYNTHLINEIGD